MVMNLYVGKYDNGLVDVRGAKAPFNGNVYAQLHIKYKADKHYEYEFAGKEFDSYDNLKVYIIDMFMGGNKMNKSISQKGLCTVTKDGTIRDIGEDLTTALAISYKQYGLTLQEVKEIHRLSAPPRDSEASKAWEYISTTSEVKFQLLNNTNATL